MDAVERARALLAKPWGWLEEIERRPLVDEMHTLLAELADEVERLRGERARVCAWLREEADDTYSTCDPVEWRRAADAIEAGKHVKP